MLDARLAALADADAETHLNELPETLRLSQLHRDEQTDLLVQAWEAAAQAAIEDGLLTLDEENPLARYADHFGLRQSKLYWNGVQTTVVQAASYWTSPPASPPSGRTSPALTPLLPEIQSYSCHCRGQRKRRW